jgi:hypothetical protein
MLRFRRLALTSKDISKFEDIILARNGKYLNTRSYQSTTSSALPLSRWFGQPSQSENEDRQILKQKIAEIQRSFIAEEISDALSDAVDVETCESISDSIYHRNSEYEGNLWNLSMPKPEEAAPETTEDFGNFYTSELHHHPVDVFEDKVYQRFSPIADKYRITIAGLDVLSDFLSKNDLNGIRKELSENLWPLIVNRSKTVMHQTFQAFIDSAKTVEDIDEILLMLSDLSKQLPSVFLSQNLLFELIKKTAEISKPEKPAKDQLYGPKKVVEVIAQIKDIFPPGVRHFHRSKLFALFETLFNHSDTDFQSASRVCNELISIDLMGNRKVFLEVAAKFLITKLKYDDAFYYWSSACSIDNIVSGGNIFLEHVLSNNRISMKMQERRISQLVKFYERVLSPSDVIAQLIVSLVSTGRMPDAKVLWIKTAVDLKHFLSPIRKLKNVELVDVNLIHIRDFAQLLEDCVLAEFKSKKRPRKTDASVDFEAISSDDVTTAQTSSFKPGTEREVIPDGNMEFLIKHWQPFRKRKYGKQKIKKFDIRADQLESLINLVQEVWVSLIELKNDPKIAGPEEFELFLARNKIPLNENLQKRVEALQKKEKIGEL